VIGKIISLITDTLLLKGAIEEDDRDIYEYGIDVALFSCLIIAAQVLLGCVFKCCIETLVMVFFFAVFQTQNGGFHARTHLGCFSITILQWIVFRLVLAFVNDYIVLFFSCSSIVSLIIVFLLAPVEHVNAPMSDKKKKDAKLISRIICSVVLVLNFLLFKYLWKLNLIFLPIAFSLTISGISILMAHVHKRKAV